MIKNHDLKCDAEYYDKVESGEKTFELRFNDRDFQVGETVTLHRSIKGIFTGSSLPPKSIVYILREAVEFGLVEGFVIMQLK